MAIAQPRPDLEAHAHSVRADFATVADEVRQVLGARLAAYVGGVKETRAVHEWAEEDRRPSEITQRRLRLALQVATMIATADGAEVAQAWFQGLNPQLDDRSPARLLREGDLDEVGPLVISAARAFLVGG
jgi:hypothetical protein